MRCRQIDPAIGAELPVRNTYHYPLPPGLPEGSIVKVLSYDSGYWTVEHMGRTFSVFRTLVSAGFEYEYLGRWFPASDPLIQRLLTEPSVPGFRG
jgi:hypothetical protein